MPQPSIQEILQPTNLSQAKPMTKSTEPALYLAEFTPASWAFPSGMPSLKLKAHFKFHLPHNYTIKRHSSYAHCSCAAA